MIIQHVTVGKIMEELRCKAYKITVQVRFLVDKSESEAE
jgi:hypothetical protein